MNNLGARNMQYIDYKIQRAKKMILLTNTMNANKVFIRNNYKSAFGMFRDAFYASGRPLWIYKEMVELGIELSIKCGCYFLFKENNYWIDCPIILSNFPGTSIGASMSSYCSICGKEVLDCNHIKGENYNNIECKKIKDKCNICLKKDCEHVVGQIYDNVQAVEVIYRIAQLFSPLI